MLSVLMFVSQVICITLLQVLCCYYIPFHWINLVKNWNVKEEIDVLDHFSSLFTLFWTWLKLLVKLMSFSFNLNDSRLIFSYLAMLFCNIFLSYILFYCGHTKFFNPDTNTYPFHVKVWGVNWGWCQKTSWKETLIQWWLPYNKDLCLSEECLFK